MPENPPPRSERELLLYIAAKVARLDAVVTALHSFVYTDLKPADTRRAEQRQWVVHQLYNKNIAAERAHLETQFPEDYKLLDQYISLGEQELIDQESKLILDVLEGRIVAPDCFREPPPDEESPDTPRL